MTTWHDVTEAVPELAGHVRSRFDAHGLGFLASIRRDGSPRISGVEPFFVDPHLWVGMMPGSRKLADVRRDPRVALHSASVDPQVEHGDVRLSGRLVELTDETEIRRVMAAFRAERGYGPEDPAPMLWLDITEVVSVRPVVDHLRIETWTPGRGHQVVERR
ncbi:MAG TPA: pyridoxamine 5'-phosphate oxidase family protein [Acidimicrobiales bacterium]|nr:pyridoxamine 5'-phosphate oxidase family protein [Acidimicrobiales bacterium]